MSEKANTSQLQGQFELDDLLPKATEAEAGYDETGALMNPGAALPEEQRLTVLAGEIRAITAHARRVLASAAIDIGKRLIEARALVPEGRWGEWLEKNVEYSQRQAQLMMQLAERYGDSLPEVYQGLGISHMTALLAAPEEAREDMARRAQEEDLSVRELKAEVEKLKAEKARDQMKLDAFLDQTDKLREEIARQDDREQEYDRAIVERDGQIKAANLALEKEKEAAQLARAKAAAAEASAEQLKRLRDEAEQRSETNAQRASDALKRANQAAKDLAEARAKIQALSEAAAAASEPVTVEVVPEAVTRELNDLRARLAQAEAAPAAPAAPQGEASASEKFRWFYANQMKPAFTTALSLLKDVAREDAHAAGVFAAALSKGCQQVMDQLGN